MDLDTSKLKSSVWLHMRRRRINNKIKAVCNYCDAILAASSKSGTNHLHSHIKSCLDKKRNEEYTTITKFDQDECRRKLVEMVVLHEHPLSIVEQLGFKSFMNSLQPLFKIPSRATVRCDIFKLYSGRLKDTMVLLGRNKGRVAITTDMWTADNQKKSYIAVTTYFVDDSWRLQQRLLRFQYVPSPHNSDVIADKIMEVLLDWDLDSKLSTITVDNCSVNDKVIPVLLDKLKKDQLLLRGDVIHMRCCAHILNLIVKEGLGVIGDGLERIRSSCVYWSFTPKKIEMFEAEAQHLQINSTKKLCYDVKIRWNSTFLMLETALIYKEVLFRLQFRDPIYKKIVPTEEDWENAKLVNEKLRIFFTITKLFSGTNYTTANHYFPKICEIRLALMEWTSDPNPKFAQMATKMLKKFNKYWSVINDIMGVAAILDPRCKQELLEYYYLKIYGKDHYKSKVDKIMVFFRKLFQEYKTRGSHDQIEESAMEDRVRKSDLPKDFLLSRRKKRRVEDELNLYINEDLVDADSENFNVLSWWMTNGQKYSTLQKIAQDVFAIPVSTVASESAFSMGGRIISPLRNRLDPKLVGALACAQNWLRAQYQDSVDHNQFKTFCDDEDEDEDQDTSVVAENVESTSNFFMRRLVGETSASGDERSD